MPEVTAGRRAGVALAGEGASRELVAADGSRAPIDVVLPVLHGPMGEDGAVQGMFELADVPYVGAGVLGSAIGMDKAIQKVLFAAAGLPVGPWEAVREPEWLEDPEGVSARDRGARLSGVREARDARLLGRHLQGARRRRARRGDGRRVPLRAQGGRGARRSRGLREIECAVLGNDDPVASVCGEIVPTGHEFYDYDSKYLDEHGARLEIPADLDADVQARVQRMAIAAFQAIECWGMARVDFFLRGDELFVNEINTIPGFTSISMYPKLWEASGLAYDDLIERLIDLAVERHDAERSKRTTAPELEARGPSDGRT